MLVTDERYDAGLRLAFHQRTGKLIGNEALHKFIGHLKAKSIGEGPELQVAIRLAQANGKVYISTAHDLANVSNAPRGEIDVYGLK